ncbi:MAG: SDR family NAD(P)-dependent oxidoreductase [bacterium]
MPIDFKGRVALITGAGGGLGRSHALHFARLGAKIVVNDVGSSVTGEGALPNPAEETVRLIREAGGEAVADASTVDTMEGAQAMVQGALRHFGRLDVLINNAGILKDASFKKQESRTWDAVIAVHLTGSRNVTHAAWETFTRQNYGRIVMTLSASGLYGNFGQTNYAAAKMGLWGLMQSLKEEGAKHNILVNAIAPMARSRMTETILPPEALERLKPESVSPVVAYLGSEACAVNGQCWAVGAGYVSRVALVESEGHFFRGEFGAEDVATHLAEITTLQNAVPLQNLMEAAAKMMGKENS